MTINVFADAIYNMDNKNWMDVLILHGPRHEIRTVIEDAMPCRTCSASPDERCTTKRGKVASRRHESRWRDAGLAVDRIFDSQQWRDPEVTP